jgi:threonine/homoserine/homoserine lactone efflux protein
MHYLLLILSGIVMGLIAAVPIGPVNLICVRRTFSFGPLNGFVSGLGAAMGDGVFAAITGLGLTWIADMIEGYAAIIELVGGAMLVYFGYRAFRSSFAPKLEDGCETVRADGGGGTLVGAIASTFALTITNPATLLAFTAMFAGLGGLAGGAGSYGDAGFVVAGVVGGSTTWWLVLTSLIGLFHTRIESGVIRQISRISGGLVMVFGLAVLINLAIKIF